MARRQPIMPSFPLTLGRPSMPRHMSWELRIYIYIYIYFFSFFSPRLRRADYTTCSKGARSSPRVCDCRPAQHREHTQEHTQTSRQASRASTAHKQASTQKAHKEHKKPAASQPHKHNAQAGKHRESTQRAQETGPADTASKPYNLPRGPRPTRHRFFFFSFAPAPQRDTNAKHARDTPL